MPLATRAQLIQHLTIIAAADGVVDPNEVGEMHRIAPPPEKPAPSPRDFARLCKSQIEIPKPCLPSGVD